MILNQSTLSHTHDAQMPVLIPGVLRSRPTAAHTVPILAGLCLSKGRIPDAARGRVDGFGQNVAVQFEVLDRWTDGSVRWLLASFIAPEIYQHDCELGVIVDAGVLSGTAPEQSAGSRLTTVKWVGNEICVISRDLSSDPPIEHTLRLVPRLCDRHDNESALQIDNIREEVTGPIRQVFVVSLKLQARPFVTLQLRLTVWMPVGLLQVETRLRNSRRAQHAGGLWDLGDAGSFLFRSLEITVGSNDIPASAMTHWKAERALPVRSTLSEVFLKQFGSGGRSWNSLNHVTATGSVEVKSRGYEAFCDAGTLRGYRAEPTVLVEADSAFLAIAVPEFWQQFPGSVASAMGTLEVGLFPALDSVTHELQGGEQKTQSFWIATGNGSGSVCDLDWVFDTPRLVQSAAAIAEAGTMPWFCTREVRVGQAAPPRRPTDARAVKRGPSVTPLPCPDLRSGEPADRIARYLHDATTGRFSLAARRDSIDEFGWRNFGDVPADHEQTHYAGSNTIVSHYNNQFDMIFGGILQFAASSDLDWFGLLDPLARHVMDIDIYHTRNDRAVFSGGLFWHTDHYVDAGSCSHRTYSRRNQNPDRAGTYGGGPSCEHNYTTGLLYYYYLTGHPEARESVLTLAEWVIQMDDGCNTVVGLLDNGATGAASGTVSEGFHGPGRGAGNSINALLDAWLLTGSDRFLSKLEELIRRCVHPSQNPDDLHLLDAEGHWSYTVFLTALGRFLLAKRDAELFDAMYSYSRDVMKTYGRWMADRERRTLDHPQELKYPTEAWAAQDFRKANVLRIAASCEDDAEQAAAMRTKADLINDAAWNDLTTFGDARLNARCLSILMTEGQREVFHRTNEPSWIPPGKVSYDFGPWSMFVPQKERVKQILKSPLGLLKASIQALRLSRIVATLKALRRHL